ncbi:transposase [Methylococcus capsulatus]|uniref:Transposase n=1 Tax=Methylococcus capsulatus TaxID=414 RepID=A0AA35UCX4_METCP|nr:transposase [Methylococcus capsulatus]
MDFMSDALMSGRRFQTFNVMDDFTREVLAIKVDLNLPADAEQLHRALLSQRPEGVLMMYVFRTWEEVRERTEAWMKDYNGELPHDALGDPTPLECGVFHHLETSTKGWH